MDTPETQTTINKTELPPFIDKAAKENLYLADKLAQRPYVPYTGKLTPGETDAQRMARGAVGRNNYSGTINSALDAAKGVSQYQQRSFLQGDVQQYLNPYIDNVENRALDAGHRAFLNNINTVGDSAVGAGAFGGSRHGIAEGVAASENARNMGDMSAQLRAQGFDTASGLLGQDLDRELQAAELRNSGAANMADIAQTGSDMTNKTAALQATLGEQQRQIQQQQLQEVYAKYKERQDYPLQGLNLRLAAVGATPYGGTQTQTSTGGGGGNTGMSVLGGIMGLLPALFSMSDEREKTDIEEVGTDPETGLKLYSFRYKGDPKTYPKVIGPMAQDVEKKYPDMVVNVAGRKAISKNLGFGGGR